MQCPLSLSASGFLVASALPGRLESGSRAPPRRIQAPLGKLPEIYLLADELVQVH